MLMNDSVQLLKRGENGGRRMLSERLNISAYRPGPYLVERSPLALWQPVADSKPGHSGATLEPHTNHTLKATTRIARGTT